MSDYRISDGSSSVIGGTGQIAIPTATTAIVGTGTAFLTQLHAGDLIIIGGTIIGSVASVTNDTAAVLTYASATGYGNTNYSIDPLVHISTITADAIDPIGSYYRWGITLPTGDALERALGRPRASWLWKNIGVNLRTALLGYCPSKSVRVYVRTLADQNTGAYVTAQAALLWPDTDNAYTPDFVIELRDLVLL